MRRERFGAGRWKTVYARGANRAAPAGRSALPLGVKPHVWLPPGAGPATYERWIVTACSHKQPFLVVFWPAKEGRMMFQVKAEKVADS